MESPAGDEGVSVQGAIVVGEEGEVLGFVVENTSAADEPAEVTIAAAAETRVDVVSPGWTCVGVDAETLCRTDRPVEAGSVRVLEVAVRPDPVRSSAAAPSITVTAGAAFTVVADDAPSGSSRFPLVPVAAGLLAALVLVAVVLRRRDPASVGI